MCPNSEIININIIAYFLLVILFYFFRKPNIKYSYRPTDGHESTSPSLSPLWNCYLEGALYLSHPRFTYQSLHIQTAIDICMYTNFKHMLSYNINNSLTWLFIENVFFYWSWSIVALYCCFSFCYTANWISHMYTYISSFLDILPIYVSAEHKVESSVLYSRFSLVIYFIYSSVYMTISVSQFIPPIPLFICTDQKMREDSNY